MEERQDNDVILELLDVDGKRVLDIGCGTGGLVRLMTGAGAKAIGLDSSRQALDVARAAAPAGSETYLQGNAKELPFENASFDVVVFFNSLHHIAGASHAEAFAEAARVLKAGGLVYAGEPLATGADFELGKPLVDETRVRAAAYESIKKAHAFGFEEITEVTYAHQTWHRDFEEFRKTKITVDAGRRMAFDEKVTEIRALFESLGRKTADGFVFGRPMRVNILRKSGGPAPMKGSPDSPRLKPVV